MNDKVKVDELVEKNTRLVWHCMKYYNININDREDVYSVGCIGLVKAANNFNESKGYQFATFASRCIHNEIKMFYRGRQKLFDEVPFDNAIGFDKLGNPFTLLHVLEVKDDKIYSDDDIELIANIENNPERYLTYMERILFKTLKKEIKQTEAASILGISQSYVSRYRKNKLIPKLIKILEKGDI